jgi:hypothetical protein
MTPSCLPSISPETKIHLYEIGKTSLQFITALALISLALYGSAKLLDLPIPFKAQLGGILTGVTLIVCGLGLGKISLVTKNRVNLAIGAIAVIAIIALVIANAKGAIDIKSYFSQQWKGLICASIVTIVAIYLIDRKRREGVKELKAEYQAIEIPHVEPASWKEIGKKVATFVLYTAVLGGVLWLGVRLFGTDINWKAHAGALITGSILTLSAGGTIYLARKLDEIKKDKILKTLTIVSILAVTTLLVLGSINQLPLLDSLKQAGPLAVGALFTAVVMKLTYEQRRTEKMKRFIKDDKGAEENPNLVSEAPLTPPSTDSDGWQNRLPPMEAPVG